MTPNNASGNGGTSMTITQKTLPNLTVLSVSSYTSSQIILAFSGIYDTVSITRDGSAIVTDSSGTTYTDSSGLTGNTSHTYIVIPYDVSGNAGTSMTITQKTLPNLTSLSVSSYTASQIVLAFSGNYTNVSITRNSTSLTTGFSGTSYTDSGLTATTSYTYIIIPYDIYGNAGTSMSLTQSTI